MLPPPHLQVSFKYDMLIIAQFGTNERLEEEPN